MLIMPYSHDQPDNARAHAQDGRGAGDPKIELQAVARGAEG